MEIPLLGSKNLVSYPLILTNISFLIGFANSPPDINNGSYFSTEKSVPPKGRPQFYLLINLLFRCLLSEGVNFYQPNKEHQNGYQQHSNINR